MPRKKTPGLPQLVDLPFRAQPAKLSKRLARRFEASRGPVNLPIQPQVGPGADMRRNDCGPACVRMGLDFLRLAPGVSIDTLSAQIDPQDDGTNWDELVTLARSHGADAFVVNVGANQLPDPPAIMLVRYSGFDRNTVQDKRYWDLSAQDPNIMHWAWWLGNVVVNGQTVSVWNDPLYTESAGKNVFHSVDELERAFAPYFGSRWAVKFTGIFNPAESGAQISVSPRDSDGVNFRTTPEIRPDNLIRRIAAGTVLTVLEDAAVATVKINNGQQQQWLRAQTPDGVIGFVAAWLVRPFTPPPSGVAAMNTVVTHGATVLRNAPNGAVIWGMADGVPLRVLPSNGPDWPARIGNANVWLEVESYAFKLGFVRADLVDLPTEADTRTPVDDAACKFGDSAWLYGIHDDFSAQRGALFPANKRGWVLFTEDVGGQGASPFQSWASNPVGFGALVRLNNGYNDGFRGPGTIPGPDGYDAFAQKCAGWAQRTLANTSSDHACTFIIGNEMNNPREWPNPNGDSNQINHAAAITPQGYADCFNRVYRAIKAVAPNARVVPGAVDPYNALYLECMQYFTQMLARIDALDGFSFHTYTHGPEVSRVTSLEPFGNDPLRWQYYDFRSYTTLMDQIPAKWRSLPVYLTETDQTPTDRHPQAWTGGRNGWVRAAYDEINRWNMQPLAQQIQALILYRWVRGGGSDALYCLQDKPDILAELRDTVANTDHRWRFFTPVSRAVVSRAAPRAITRAVKKRKPAKRQRRK